MLAPFRSDLTISKLEKAALSFAIGFGVIGWLFFWLAAVGHLSAGITLTLCTVLSLGLFFADPLKFRFPVPPSTTEKMLILLLCMVFFLDFVEALAPPVEADTLAYQFELPRRFIEQSKLFFIPRALDGAVPLLVQMTYVAALLVSDNAERSLTLWTFISGWGAGFFLFALSLRWLSRSWGMAIWLLFQTLPSMLYSAGSGHVEPRLAMFVLIAAVGLLHLRNSNKLWPIFFIGLGAGLYAGGKYTGLLFVAAAGLSVFIFGSGQRLKKAVVFGIISIIAGGQWYGWNFFHTGDPVFPILFNVLGLQDGPYWDHQHATKLTAYLNIRYEQIKWWERWLTYPISATLFPPPAIEAGRVGLGPYFLLIAPVALFGLWKLRHRVFASSLFPILATIAIYYVLWIKFGGIPKVRHLLPVIPVLILGMTLLALKSFSGWKPRTFGTLPVAVAMTAALAVNFAALGFFAAPFTTHIASGLPREDFLRTQVNGYRAAQQLNQIFGVKKALVTYRAFLYYIKPPTLFVFPYLQKQIQVSPGTVRSKKFWKQLKTSGISHILTDRPVSMSSGPNSLESAIQTLVSQGCLEILRRTQIPWHQSRTLRALANSTRTFEVLKLDQSACRLNEL